MKIMNIDGLTVDELQREVSDGGKFVFYQYSISLLVVSFRRSSDVYFIRAHENGVVKGLPYTFMSFFLGWWGIPWGPIYTVGSLYNNLRGGKNVTTEIMPMFAVHKPLDELTLQA